MAASCKSLNVTYVIASFSPLRRFKKWEKTSPSSSTYQKRKEVEILDAQCGIKISPDDRSEDVYTVLEPVMKEDQLEKIVLQCNRCGSKIHLIGFHALEKLD